MSTSFAQGSALHERSAFAGSTSFPSAHWVKVEHLAPIAGHALQSISGSHCSGLSLQAALNPQTSANSVDSDIIVLRGSTKPSLSQQQHWASGPRMHPEVASW